MFDQLRRHTDSKQYFIHWCKTRSQVYFVLHRLYHAQVTEPFSSPKLIEKTRMDKTSLIAISAQHMR